jgi:uncharacterized protein YukE
VDLPGRPGGDADHLRAVAAAWEHLAWELWNLDRHLEQGVQTLLDGWGGPAADAFARRWNEVRRGFPELDHRLHAVADRLRLCAGAIEDGQATYDHTLAAAGIVTVAGIGLTLLTLGGSDVVADGADTALAASLTGELAGLELTLARLGTLLSEAAAQLDGLADRFAVSFGTLAPRLAYSPAGGAAMGVGVALASGTRDPADLAASGVLGAAENVGGGRRGGSTEAEDGEAGPPAIPGSARTPGPVEEAWRASLSPAQAAKQAEFDRMAEVMADPARANSIRERLTARVAAAIHVHSPGTLLYVDRQVIDRESTALNALTDIDLETGTAAIQLKAGRTDGLSTQMEKTRSVTGKTVVALAPKMDDATWQRYQRHGDVVFRNLEDLLEFLRSHS